MSYILCQKTKEGGLGSRVSALVQPPQDVQGRPYKAAGGSPLIQTHHAGMWVVGHASVGTVAESVEGAGLPGTFIVGLTLCRKCNGRKR